MSGEYGNVGQVERVQHPDRISILFDFGPTKGRMWDRGMVGLGYCRSEAIDGFVERFQYYSTGRSGVSSEEESRHSVSVY